jgi:hypothetical protein
MTSISYGGRSLAGGFSFRPSFLTVINRRLHSLGIGVQAAEQTVCVTGVPTTISAKILNE